MSAATDRKQALRRARNLRYRAKQRRTEQASSQESETAEDWGAQSSVPASLANGVDNAEEAGFGASLLLARPRTPDPSNGHRVVHTDPALALAFQTQATSPIAFPATTHHMYAMTFCAINHSLDVWGYLDNPRGAFQYQITQEYEAHSDDDVVLRTWVEEKERWLLEGDKILSAIEEAMCGEPTRLANGASTFTRDVFRVLCCAILKIQYMIAVVEGRLDSIAADRGIVVNVE